METAIVICVLVIMTPMIIFALYSGHLTRSLADFISGKRSGAREMQDMKERITRLESELSYLTEKYVALEESHEFSTKLLEDLKNRQKDIKN
ncbi:MAG: hypothetical protein K2Z81_19815 [Cyanobacteria bacterium]|nr:hypothetical protein [Cyanobacteriota bacterium]